MHLKQAQTTGLLRFLGQVSFFNTFYVFLPPPPLKFCVGGVLFYFDPMPTSFDLWHPKQAFI